MKMTETVDRNAVIGSLVREGTDSFGMQDYFEGYQDLEDVPFGVAIASERTRREVIEMTIENRGAVVRLKRTERLTWTPPTGEPVIWYGLFDREVELRVWHDGSVTVEFEVER